VVSFFFVISGSNFSILFAVVSFKYFCVPPLIFTMLCYCNFSKIARFVSFRLLLLTEKCTVKKLILVVVLFKVLSLTKKKGGGNILELKL